MTSKIAELTDNLATYPIRFARLFARHTDAR